jgi:hypothetical protein
METIKSQIRKFLRWATLPRVRPERTAFDDEYIPGKSLYSSLADESVLLLYMSVIVAIIGYVSAQMFMDSNWLAYQIAVLYGLICKGGACDLKLLNASLVYAVCLVTMVFLLLSKSIDDMFLPRDGFYQLHEHLELLSRQLKTDYKRVTEIEDHVSGLDADISELQGSVTKLESTVSEADNRVDIVMEVTTVAHNDGDDGQITSAA